MTDLRYNQIFYKFGENVNSLRWELNGLLEKHRKEIKENEQYFDKYCSVENLEKLLEMLDDSGFVSY